MTISFNAALSAYNNAANIFNVPQNNTEDESTSGAINGANFAGVMGNSASGAISSLKHAESTVAKSLVKQADITDVVTAITNAEVTLRTVVEVRDRLISAHQEILRMPI